MPAWPSQDSPDRAEASLDTLVPDNPFSPYDIEEPILKVVFEGHFFEMRERFAANIVSGFARIEGSTVGVVANQPMVLAGVLDSDASRKAVRFCDAFGIPVVTFVDVPGFLPGRHRRAAGSSRTGQSSSSPTVNARCPW